MLERIKEEKEQEKLEGVRGAEQRVKISRVLLSVA